MAEPMNTESNAVAASADGYTTATTSSIVLLRQALHPFVDQPTLEVLRQVATGCPCCPHCCFAFALSAVPAEIFSLDQQSLYALLVDVLQSVSSPTASSQAPSAGTTLDVAQTPCRPLYQPGSTVCVCCLDIQALVEDPLFASQIADSLHSEGRIFRDFRVDLKLPAATLLRRCAIQQWYRPGSPLDSGTKLKTLMQTRLPLVLSRQLNCPRNNDSGLRLGICFNHVETRGEYQQLNQLSVSNMRARKRSRRSRSQGKVRRANIEGVSGEEEEVSLSELASLLQRIKPAEFASCFKLPSAPLTGCSWKLTAQQDSVFVGGRYMKLQRNISHTPWEVGGVRKTELCVSELVAAPLEKHFRCVGVNFVSSGREDADVRMLGEGRPFVLECIDPKNPFISAEKVLEAQREINKSVYVQVHKLQMVSKSACKALLKNEAEKRKTYRCVIWSERELTQVDMDHLSSLKEVVIKQRTPVRVFHRRAALERPRTIYNMSAHLLEPHFFFLDLTSQSGTYIKEFVYGDLGRTEPSVASLLKTRADILQLDVMAVLHPFP